MFVCFVKSENVAALMRVEASPFTGKPSLGLEVHGSDRCLSALWVDRAVDRSRITPKKGGRFGYHHEGVDSASEAEGKSLDPLTIFVGGLEMFGQHAWDEGKLWELFGKHGEVENVQLVKPRRWSCELLCSFYIINALQHSKQEKRICICDVREFRSEQSCGCC